MVMISRIILEVCVASSIALFFIGHLKVFVLFLFTGSSRMRGKTGGDASHSYQHSLVASQAQSLSDDQLRAILQALMVPT